MVTSHELSLTPLLERQIEGMGDDSISFWPNCSGLWLSNKIQQNDFIFKELQLSGLEVAKKK